MNNRMKELLSTVSRTIPDYEGLTDEQMMNTMREEDIQGILPHNMDYLRDGADETSLGNAMNLIELRRLIGGVGEDNVEYMQSLNAIKRLMEGLGLPLKKEYEESQKAFDIALDGMLEKFADCPICQGEPEYCPTPQMGYQRCPTRRSAIKHMRRGKEPRIRRM